MGDESLAMVHPLGEGGMILRDAPGATARGTGELAPNTDGYITTRHSHYRNRQRRFARCRKVMVRMSRANHKVLLANSETSIFRLAFHFFEGTEAWNGMSANLLHGFGRFLVSHFCVISTQDFGLY